MRYRFGRMKFDRLMTRAAGYLKGESLAELDELGEQLFVERVSSRVFPFMREVVRAHQQQGHTVVLSSSALTIHAEPVARYLQIPHVLCNHFELDDRGLLTGRIARPVIWGRNKAAAVQLVLHGQRREPRGQLLLRRRQRRSRVDERGRQSQAGEPPPRPGRGGRRAGLAGAAGRRARWPQEQATPVDRLWLGDDFGPSPPVRSGATEPLPGWWRGA